VAENPKQAPARRKSSKQIAEEHAPWIPARYEAADATALQALRRGDCPAHLQQRALNFIMWDLCGLRDLSFRPGGVEGERETNFAEGKRFVGLQIGKLLEMKVNRGGEQP
jgi:hypothetical protein